MFRSAYIRLSLWYVAIIMVISLIFSVWVYQEAMSEVRSSLGGPIVVRLKDRFGPVAPDELQTAIDQQYADSQGRILFNLILLNVAVLGLGGVASYGLARRTLRPIEDAVDAQNRFTADASHELRTPLAAMKTEVEVALRDPNLTNADMQELLASNLEEIDRMSGLTEGLLTLARTGEALRLGAVRADAIVKDVAKRLKPLADAKHITIKKELAETKVMAESKSLATIVGILLDNAIKYSPAKTTITIKTERQDGYGVITVSDQGPGVAPADLPHIFERFYRADSSRTTQKVAGHGLGLSIAQKLTGAMQGSLTASCAEGKGCTFTLRLPNAQ